MSSKDISEFPGMYRLDPVQSVVNCDQNVMINATGMLCTTKPIKTSGMTDTESELFGIASNPTKSPEIPVPDKIDPYVIPNQNATFLNPMFKHRGPQRGQQQDRFIHSYPTIPTVTPEQLHVGSNTRQLYKM